MSDKKEADVTKLYSQVRELEKSILSLKKMLTDTSELSELERMRKNTLDSKRRLNAVFHVRPNNPTSRHRRPLASE